MNKKEHLIQLKEILIFAGTTEGRKLSESLSASGIAHTLCVATGYGEIVLKEHPLAKVHRGRMDREQIREYIKNGDFCAVVDATHPYAEAVTENIKAAMDGVDIPCLRLKRETDAKSSYEKIVYFSSTEECAKALENTGGNILLTTGSKELAAYCSSKELKERLYVRVLPGIESLMLCMDQGIQGKQILALQGPFTTEMNEAMIRQYQINCLVTKASGRTGGYPEKLEAAKKVGIPVFVVGRPAQGEGYSFNEICEKLEIICAKKIKRTNSLEITLAGTGMGSKGSLTREVFRVIESADILLGAERLLAEFGAENAAGLQMADRIKLCEPFYRAEQIIPYLKGIQEKDMMPDGGKVAILFSGDSGFYSGCRILYEALQEEISRGGLDAVVRIMPGISSVSYLAACIGENYQDAAIYSMHGRALSNLLGKIKREKKTFLLMSGVEDVNRLGEQLQKAGLSDCEILAGYQLSYPEQQIMALTPKECCELKKEGLYICCIRNPRAESARLTHGLADGEFIRDSISSARVPMTKEEVREVSICKLKLHKGAVMYDIGSGTGSVAIEAAGLSDDIRVFAVEKKEAAVSLIKQNMEKFHLENITVIPANAPEGLAGLPVPTHAFIGGSGGRMKEILDALYQLNPRMRVVINAVSVETICEIKEVLSLYPMEQKEIVQLQVNRAKKAGLYLLMQAENPVWIYGFNFAGTENGK